MTASAINLQVRGERETSAGQRHCQASGKSPESARDRQIHGEQNADGVDEQPQNLRRVSRSPESASGGRSTVIADDQLSKQAGRSTALMGGRAGAIMRSRRRQAIARSKASMSGQTGLWRQQDVSRCGKTHSKWGGRRHRQSVGGVHGVVVEPVDGD